VFGGLAVTPLAGDKDLRRLDLILRRPQTLSLLAILATAGPSGVSRERLLELLWHDGDTVQTRNALAQLLFRTRRTLGNGTITGRQTLRLSESVVSCDLAEFWHALESGRTEEAVALYTGPLFDGIHDWETPALARWAAHERTRVNAAYHSALGRGNGGPAHPPSTRAAAMVRRARGAGGLLIAATLIVVLASSLYVERRTERRARAVLVFPFINETGDSAFDELCRRAASTISSVIPDAHGAQGVVSNAAARNESDAVSVKASLFRMGTDSLVLFMSFVRQRDGRILAADTPLVVATAHRDQLIALARERVLAFFSGQDVRVTGDR
jgi:hypothetical protein